MITEKMINPLVASMINRECVIKRFSDRGNQDLDAIRRAYLEMAYLCINEYGSIIRSGSTDYYRASKMLSKSAFAARQAANVQWATERRKQ